MALTRDELVARLVRAGELEVSGADQAEIDSYFDTREFRFHGPDGFEADYAGLTNYFKSIRAAFNDRSIRRGTIVAEGNYIACQTWMEGTFVREFTHSPAGAVPSNGQRVLWDLINIFRFDDHGKLVEEWVRTDHRSFLRQLLESPPVCGIVTDVPNQDNHREPESPGKADPAEPVTPSGVLASRFHQMFPVLSPAEIDRVRRFGEIRRFAAGEFLSRAGEAAPPMYVILSGRVAIVLRDAFGQALPVAPVAELIGAPLEQMTDVAPGEVMAELGHLSGRKDMSAIDARAVGDVEAIVVPPEALRTLLVAEAELGERILRALILRRVALIELGFGGPVLIGAVKSPEVTRLSTFLERNGIPFRVIDLDADPDASPLLARYAPEPGELPIVVMPDGAVLKNPTKQELARALGLVATSFRSEPYDVAIVGAGPAGLATAVYGASEGLSVLVLEALAFGGQAGASARIENYLGFPTGVSGQALMGRAFTQAQKFGVEFSLSTEVTRLDRTSEASGPDPVQILELADGRRVRTRAVVVATGARYRRPEIPNLAQFEGRGVSYWASPAEARLCRNEDVALVGGGNSAGQAAVFLASNARHVRVLVRGPQLSSTMSRYLVDRIAAVPNIAVLCDSEVMELLGRPDQSLQGVRWRNRRTGAEEQHAIAHLFLFTGADPAASWLTGCGIPLDEKGFIRTGADVGATERVPLPLETGVEGIFAVGDVRCGSVKRVGAAIGEGAAVVAQLHTFLARRGSTTAVKTRARSPRSAG